MKKRKFFCALLYVENDDCPNWMDSLKKYQEIEYDTIDLSYHNWLESCFAKNYDIYILRPPGTTNNKKQMFDERMEILENNFNIKTYPSITEAKIYENKKYLSYWLKAKKLPSPLTEVFYKENDALNWLETAGFPIVAKINIGASGKGVKILQNHEEAVRYIHKAFSEGIRPYIGPNIKSSPIFFKFKNIILKKGLLQKRIKSYKATFNEPQKYVIFQEYINHNYEWRAVVIGESYFAHKKIVTGEKASGSLKKDYTNPPLELLSFVKKFCNEHNLSSVSLDIFETPNGFLVNEIQTYFGQSDSFQMKVDSVIGRYRFIENTWVFEAGDFARNKCYDLRVEHLLNIMRK